jgi:uncharacterized DUF497 family protein
VVRFLWDKKKEAANVAKHGVDFTEAEQAFLDSERILLEDTTHSESEPRLFCIGRTRRGILTVRYTRRSGHIRIIGAGYWRKGKSIYEKENR